MSVLVDPSDPPPLSHCGIAGQLKENGPSDHVDRLFLRRMRCTEVSERTSRQSILQWRIVSPPTPLPLDRLGAEWTQPISWRRAFLVERVACIVLLPGVGRRVARAKKEGVARDGTPKYTLHLPNDLVPTRCHKHGSYLPAAPSITTSS